MQRRLVAGSTLLGLSLFAGTGLGSKGAAATELPAQGAGGNSEWVTGTGTQTFGSCTTDLFPSGEYQAKVSVTTTLPSRPIVGEIIPYTDTVITVQFSPDFTQDILGLDVTTIELAPSVLWMMLDYQDSSLGEGQQYPVDGGIFDMPSGPATPLTLTLPAGPLTSNGGAPPDTGPVVITPNSNNGFTFHGITGSSDGVDFLLLCSTVMSVTEIAHVEIVDAAPMTDTDPAPPTTHAEVYPAPSDSPPANAELAHSGVDTNVLGVVSSAGVITLCTGLLLMIFRCKRTKV